MAITHNKYKIDNKRKTNFFFSQYNRARLVFKKSHSNYFFTLLDLKGKVICCKSSGCTGFTKNKRKKMSFQSIESIVNLLMPLFRTYKIENLDVIFKDLPSALYYIIVNYLELKKMKIISIKMACDLPHNGVRGRNVRRV